MATASICPVVGTTTNVLPPHHPEISHDDAEARCPVTNAKVQHHDNIIHNHPSTPLTSDEEKKDPMNALSCPALKGANAKDSITDATCPVVGPVNAHLPPTHPALSEKEAGAICPVTNAKLLHHKGKVSEHVRVADDASAQKCPVAGAQFSA